MSAVAPVTRPPSSASLLAHWAKAVLVGAGVASVLAALWKYGGQLAGRAEHLRGTYVLGAVLVCLVYRIVNASGWVLVLRALGQRMGVVEGARIWLVTETLRWLPGSVWGLVSRTAQASAAGVPLLTASLTPPIELVLTVASWVLVAAAGLGVSGTAAALASKLSLGWIFAAAGAVLLGGGAGYALVRLRPSGRFATKLRGLAESLTRLKATRPSFRWLAVTLLFFTVLGFVNGACFLLVLAAASDVHPGLLASSGINALGWLLGFFAFFAPSGLGVREGGTTVLLAPLMPLDAAVAAALLWRVIQVVVELACLAVCLVPRALRRVRAVGGAECEKVV